MSFNHNNKLQLCKYCQISSNAHSFYLSNNDDVNNNFNDNDNYNNYNNDNNDNNNFNKSANHHLYKTMIADAELYNKPKTIIYHMKIQLNRNQTPKMNHWNWVIDFKGAGVKHYLAFVTVRELSRWINSEKDGLCKNLKNIKIKNAGIMIKPMIGLSKWFLPEHINVECL
jgi:hypothetical protein